MMTLIEEMKQKVVLATAHNDFEKGLNARAFFKLHDHEISENLVQDAFMKTWVYLVKGGKIDVMKAFLYHTLNHLIIDEYRKHKTTSLDKLIENGFEPKEITSENISSAMDGKMAVLLIQRLPETYKKVMRMRYIQDLSLQEISLITSQSKNAIAVQLHRGMEKLKLLYNH